MIGYAEVRPSADLAAFVECYWAISGRLGPGDEAINRVLPDGCMDVIMQSSGSVSAIAVGTMTAPLVVRATGAVDSFGVRYRSGCGGLALGVPAVEMTDSHVALDALWSDAAEIVERIAGIGYIEPAADDDSMTREPMHVATSTMQRPGSTSRIGTSTRSARDRGTALLLSLRAKAREMEEILRRRLSRGAGPDPLVMGALQCIATTTGNEPVHRLEQELGTTARMLERRFADAVGVSPKVASRITRFQAAAAAIRHDPSISLARLAVHTGYHDQAHMTREFTRLAGLPPAAYARERRVGFVQDFGSTTV